MLACIALTTAAKARQVYRSNGTASGKQCSRGPPHMLQSLSVRMRATNFDLQASGCSRGQQPAQLPALLLCLVIWLPNQYVCCSQHAFIHRASSSCDSIESKSLSSACGCNVPGVHRRRNNRHPAQPCQPGRQQRLCQGAFQRVTRMAVDLAGRRCSLLCNKPGCTGASAPGQCQTGNCMS